MKISPRDRKLDPAIDWLSVASRKRMVGDRIGYRECLRLARQMRLIGQRGSRVRTESCPDRAAARRYLGVG